jgi:hypothetical protein
MSCRGFRIVLDLKMSVVRERQPERRWTGWGLSAIAYSPLGHDDGLLRRCGKAHAGATTPTWAVSFALARRRRGGEGLLHEAPHSLRTRQLLILLRHPGIQILQFIGRKASIDRRRVDARPASSSFFSARY